METIQGSFTVDAAILGGRQRHHRQRDHFGAESDLFVVLDQDVGPYPEQTPIHFVLEDFLARLVVLESSTKAFGQFTADAYIWPYYVIASAVIKLTVEGTFTVDAAIINGGSFTADAVIQGGGTLTFDAEIA